MIWLFGEIWAWILAGFLLGLLVGWWIWSQTAPTPAAASSTVTRLRTELDSCASTLARAQSDLAAANRLRKALETSLAAAGAPVTPLFLSAPNGQCDDLTRISGIGPRLATLLADIGIFHIWQIAGWSPDDIAEVDAKLGAFSGRIVRDKWVEQANALM
jgi:predicted flap endonuclease-1-like 5' DNA nuclease